MKKNKTVFLTGAAGFIGFHAAQHLVNRGDRVIGFDNFNAYYSPQLKKDRVEKLGHMGIEVIEGDLTNSTLLAEIYQKYDFTHTLHLAAQAGVRYSLTHPQAYVESNLQGFINLLEVCRHYPKARFVFASSSSVYGCNSKIPFSEKDQTDRPANLYGATKKANELIAYSYHSLYGISMAGLRFFTVYGPWGRPDMAYFSFTKRIFEGQPIEVFNQGKMTRDFTYINDIVSGILASIDLDNPFEIFNLGNNRPADLAYFISLLEKSIGKKAILDYKPMQPGEMEITYADISHSQKILGFTPLTTLEEGIPNFVNWYRNYFQHKVS